MYVQCAHTQEWNPPGQDVREVLQKWQVCSLLLSLCKELQVLSWDNIVLQCNSFIELVGSTSPIGRVKADTQILEGHVLFQVVGHLLNGPGEY